MKTLQQLKDDNLPCAKLSDINLNIRCKIDDESLKEEAINKINKYLELFLPPSEKCPSCEGMIAIYFQWELVHGEGSCLNCNYPFRAIHKIEDVVNIDNMLLAYHPDYLEESD